MRRMNQKNLTPERKLDILVVVPLHVHGRFLRKQSNRLLENAHLLRYPHPSSLRRTSMYASFLGISEALHLDVFNSLLTKCFSETC
jgi:hypothetical protein